VSDALCAAEIDTRPPAEAESLWEYFHSSEVDFWDSQNRLVTLVLVFDQFAVLRGAGGSSTLIILLLAVHHFTSKEVALVTPRRTGICL
jgi:hypothetical protein